MTNGIVASLNPASSVAVVADGALAPETYQIDLGVPLPMTLTDRALGIERAVSRLKRDNVESVRTVWSFAINDVAGVDDQPSPQHD